MDKVPKGYKKTKVGVIPEDWEVVKLNEISSIGTGKTPLKNNKSFWNHGTFNWATTTEVNTNYITSTKAKITEYAVEKLNLKIFPVNTILLATYGQGKTRGKVALLKIESTINQAFASIVPSKKYNTNYVFNHLMQSYSRIREMSHGSNQDNLNLDIVKSITIPFPPLKEQKKIAEILSIWDDAIAIQEELIKAKEKQKKGLMQRLLSGEVRFPEFGSGVLTPPCFSVSVGGTKVPLPDGWEEVRLSHISFKKSSTISANTIEQNHGKYLIYGAGVGRVLLCEVYSSVLGTIDIIKPKGKNLLYFLYYLLQITCFKKFTTGSTIPHIYYKDYSLEKIKLPSSSEQQKIAQVLTLADNEIDLLKNELSELKHQKKGLMQKLFTGEVRVKV